MENISTGAALLRFCDDARVGVWENGGTFQALRSIFLELLVPCGGVPDGDPDSPGRVVNLVTSAPGQALRVRRGKMCGAFFGAKGNDARNRIHEGRMGDARAAKAEVILRLFRAFQHVFNLKRHTAAICS